MYDIFIEGVEGYGLRFIAFRDYGKWAVAGSGKMVQRFLKALLTPIGTDPSDLEYGTELVSTIGAARMPETEMRAFSVMECDKAMTKIQEYDMNSILEDNERLSSAEVIGVDLLTADSSYSLYIQLISMSGKPIVVEVVLPGA